MKKLLFLFYIFITLVFTSCEKSEIITPIKSTTEKLPLSSQASTLTKENVKQSDWENALDKLIVSKYPIMFESYIIKFISSENSLENNENLFPVGIEGNYTPMEFELYDLGGTAPVVIVTFNFIESDEIYSYIYCYKEDEYIKNMKIINSGHYSFHKDKSGEVILEIGSVEYNGFCEFFSVKYHEGEYKFELIQKIDTLEEYDNFLKENLDFTVNINSKFPELKNQIIEKCKESNKKYRDWRYTYTEFLYENFIINAQGNDDYTYSLFDFDKNGIPELLVTEKDMPDYGYVYTYENNNVKKLEHEFDNIINSQAYVYENKYDDLYGLVFIYDTGMITVAYLYEMEDGKIKRNSFMSENAVMCYPRHFIDGTKIEYSNIERNGLLSISNENFDRLWEETMDEKNILRKENVFYFSFEDIYSY